MAELNLALKLKAQDQASRVFRRAQSQITQSTRAMAQARERLGVRSEHKIQQEINHTIAAYNRLKRSGTATSRELARAAEATRSKIAGLNAEMGKTTWGQRLGNVGRNIAGATVGVAAGAAVAVPKIRKAADYDLEVAKIANTAYSGASIEEKTKGKEKIHGAIKASLNYGGTKEDALGAVGRLIGEGNVSVEDALKLLPTIQMNATATGASTDDISALVNSLLNFGIKVDDIQQALDYASASGKAGGFELKDMARYAPEFLSAAGNTGLGGLEDLKQVFKGAQQVYKVSGGTGQSSTNLVNFFSKLRSSDTAKKFEKLEVYDPKTKKTHGIDFEKSMTNEMKTGKNAVEAFMSIIDQVLASDRTYQKLLKKLNNAKDDKEAQAIAERIAKYVETTKLAEVMPDIQAGTAMFAMRRDKNTAQNVDEQYAIAEKGNFNKEDFDFMRQQNSVRFQIAKNKQEMNSIENWNGANDRLGNAADWLSENIEEFPNLTKAVVGATDALQIFSAGLAGFSLVNLLTGGKMGGGALGKVTQGAATSAIANGAGKLLNIGGKVATATGAAMVVGGLMIAGEQLTTEEAKAEEKAEAKTAQEKQLENQFYANAYGGNKPTTTHYAPQGFGYNKNSVWGTASRSGEVAEIARKDEVAKVRLERGTLNQAEYNERMRQSAVKIAEIRNQGKGYSGLAVAANDTDSALSRTLGDLSSLANYQADFQHFGQTISDGLKTAIESQNFTIQNQIKIDMDGRPVYEGVAENIYQSMKRG
ncbi:TPA: phage tail tape measure protein [Haemophilus influenzae]|uniref:phage tail tape measure protein n=1 Tax=Haemophilus influenzae TaxID=727 RepID=UPI0005D94BF5|nr:phage tail tape measure protein [Haemophilus influenzae]KMZ33366.1 phage tail length tape measure protein [Haemophilus influenzae]MCK9088609.1 phage tail tape measure protein [Haemophilus influenzae]MCK9099931.1 phage tail tape measure protein [Haemophilus influenzae]ORJ40058.1 phage tail tape measure protein [Haemophilus influenzae]PRK18203.1 Phage-related minor tail protein [Haemophilus influenzae]